MDDGEFSSVAGIAYDSDGEIVETAVRAYETDLYTLPFPAWDLLDLPATYDRKLTAE